MTSRSPRDEKKGEVLAFAEFLRLPVTGPPYGLEAA